MRKSGKNTRIFFATDVHGSERCFRKFINAAKIFEVDTLILGGDITGKAVVPIVKQSDHSYACSFLGNNLSLDSQDKVEEIKGKISDTGQYPYLTTAEEMQELQGDKNRADKIYLELMLERLKDWLAFMEQHLHNLGVKCFVTGGNDDPFEIEEVLASSNFIVNPDNKVVTIDESHEMISMAFSNPTPWNTPRELTEEQLRERIDSMCAHIQDMNNCIFNFHVPPLNTGLDTAAKLDTTQDPPKPIMSGGQPLMIGVGSVSIREAILRYQPLLSLHGHIHESRAMTKLGRTYCINPGSEYGEGILKGVIVNLRGNKVASYQFISG